MATVFGKSPMLFKVKKLKITSKETKMINDARFMDVSVLLSL